LRHKRPGEKISVVDLELALHEIRYTLKPFDIVMIMNGRDKFLGSEEYFEQPGMTRESTLWLVNQGIKVIGVDMYGFDRKFGDMAEEFRRTGDGRGIWKAHFAGIEKEYCQIEKLANLDQMPRPTGFKVCCLPPRHHLRGTQEGILSRSQQAHVRFAVRAAQKCDTYPTATAAIDVPSYRI
jgi:kynurenine formamidase